MENKSEKKFENKSNKDNSKIRQLIKKYDLRENEEYIITPSGRRIPKWDVIPIVIKENGQEKVKNVRLEKIILATVKYPDKNLSDAIKLFERDVEE